MLDAFPIYHWFHNGNPYSGAEGGMRYVITARQKGPTPPDESGKKKIEFLNRAGLARPVEHRAHGRGKNRKPRICRQPAGPGRSRRLAAPALCRGGGTLGQYPLDFGL